MKILLLFLLLTTPVCLTAQEFKVGDASQRLNESFHENRIDVSYETAALFNVGGNANSYVILPQTTSIRWQLDDVGNEGWRRGNTEWVFSGYYSPVVEGPEDHFTGAMFGPRYNFVQEGWKFVPYIESKVGFGFTTASGVQGAQGQDFCFSFSVGSGVRYLVSDRLEISLGAIYQHYSNAGLSEPARLNNGLDAIGPVLGFSWKL
ncbi:MAG: acyloxyacyl hydrolase [Blastochloris sp.]|nr:acyloxyacyl hydrolase [Blastochloris sp.]